MSAVKTSDSSMDVKIRLGWEEAGFSRGHEVIYCFKTLLGLLFGKWIGYGQRWNSDLLQRLLQFAGQEKMVVWLWVVPVEMERSGNWELYFTGRTNRTCWRIVWRGWGLARNLGQLVDFKICAVEQMVALFLPQCKKLIEEWIL